MLDVSGTSPMRQYRRSHMRAGALTVPPSCELVDFRQPGIFAKQVGQRAALKPLTMQAPFAARRQKTVGDQHEQHLIPMRPFAAHSQLCRPELIELQFS